MTARLAVYRLRQPLETPYALSFARLEAIESLIIVLASDGRSGLGEITPLPGYSDETVDGAVAALRRVCADLDGGTPLAEIVAGLEPTDPMVASGLACAAETLAEGEAAAFGAPVDLAMPLAGLCGGDTPERAATVARALLRDGYRHLKLKVGAGDLEADLARLRAVATVAGDVATLSLDANQRLCRDDAHRLCAVAADLPVVLLEQPFPPAAWEAFADLARATPLPLMLDESIWGAGDIERAAEAGARWVKLKLCKHPGMAKARRLVDRAQALGLGVVWGNGVQGAIGNHLEARTYAAAGLDSPGEFNGVLKLAADPFRARISVIAGQFRDFGMPPPASALAPASAIMDHPVRT